MNDATLKTMSEIQKKTATATEKAILAQLNDFVSRGLIVVEVSESFLTRQSDSSQLEVSQRVVLKLKDQEYIEKLEKRVEELTAIVGKVER